MSVEAVGRAGPVDLEEYLSEGIFPPGFHERDDSAENYKVPDADRDLANRWLWKAISVTDRLADDEAVAAAEVARVNAWLADRRQRAERDLVWLTKALEVFARRSGERTVKLPNGTLRLRRSQPSAIFTDESAAAAWLFHHAPTAVETKRTVRKGVVKALFRAGPWQDAIVGEAHRVVAPLVDDEGEVVPGVQLVRAPDDYTFTWGRDA